MIFVIFVTDAGKLDHTMEGIIYVGGICRQFSRFLPLYGEGRG